jgi:hypothetical protein
MDVAGFEWHRFQLRPEHTGVTAIKRNLGFPRLAQRRPAFVIFFFLRQP